MAIPVIFSNSTAGMIEIYRLEDLISQGKIVAYKRSDNWVEIGSVEEKDAGQPPPQPVGDLIKDGIINGKAQERKLSTSPEKRPREDKDMLIGVIYKNNRRGMIDEYLLEELIKEDKIKAFRRSGGWAKIGRDPVRERWKSSSYKGQERRKRELPPDYFL
jgi:NDP-sugar pyrophosphorylase family protein